jgi:hypothetical protein
MFFLTAAGGSDSNQTPKDPTLNRKHQILNYQSGVPKEEKKIQNPSLSQIMNLSLAFRILVNCPHVLIYMHMCVYTIYTTLYMEQNQSDHFYLDTGVIQ